MSAPNPFSIAIGGLRPGGSTLEIASQGMLTITITPTPEEDGEDIGLFPIRFYGPADTRPYDSRRRDCVVEVRGCRATISATRDNIAASNLTSAEQDIYDDIAFCDECNRRLDEREAEEAAARANERARERDRQAEENRAESERRENFQQATSHLAEQLRDGGLPLEDMAGIIIGFFEHQQKLEARIEALMAEKKPAAKGRK